MIGGRRWDVERSIGELPEATTVSREGVGAGRLGAGGIGSNAAPFSCDWMVIHNVFISSQRTAKVQVNIEQNANQNE